MSLDEVEGGGIRAGVASVPSEPGSVLFNVNKNEKLHERKLSFS